MTRAYGGVFQR